MTQRLSDTVIEWPRRGPTVNEIAALIDRYTGVQASGRFRIYNRETGDMMPGEFSDLSAAMAGARLAAASDIRALMVRAAA